MKPVIFCSRFFIFCVISLFLCACNEKQADETKLHASQNVTNIDAINVNTKSTELSNYLTRPPEDDVIYFMLPDRFENGDPTNDTGGFGGDRLQNGFDPSHRGFYHGGDLKGLTTKLDYIQGLGASAIWLGPIYKNKPVQGGDGAETAGYHGYWITDFKEVDPHLGTKEDLKAFVDAAHARNIKVYLDIITNHTADVIKYMECHIPDQPKAKWIWDCPYLSKADYPYSTQGGIDGAPINPGFAGTSDEQQTAANFEKLIDINYAYTPYVPQGEKHSKSPAWLNDPIYYHNRGDSDWWGESALDGDFAGLDDLMTEHPRVVEGFIDIFKYWISEYRIDGFRIDTAKHVNANFWRQFLPAMKEHAASIGIPNFYIFGEVAYDYNPGAVAKATRVDGFDYALDFAFRDTVVDLVSGRKNSVIFDDLILHDHLYKHGLETARGLPTFLGNHDQGRFSGKLKQANPEISQQELLNRTKVGHAIMMFMRGVPVIYSGSEQGFVSDGGDQLAREDLFPSKVAEYNDNDLIGTDKTTAEDNFDISHPLYQYIAQMSAIRRAHPALSQGELKLRLTQKDGHVLGFSRFDPVTNKEYVIVINTGANKETVNVEIDYASTEFVTLMGDCPETIRARGALSVKLDAFGVSLCMAH